MSSGTNTSLNATHMDYSVRKGVVEKNESIVEMTMDKRQMLARGGELLSSDYSPTYCSQYSILTLPPYQLFSGDIPIILRIGIVYQEPFGMSKLLK